VKECPKSLVRTAKEMYEIKLSALDWVMVQFMQARAWGRMSIDTADMSKELIQQLTDLGYVVTDKGIKQDPYETSFSYHDYTISIPRERNTSHV
jgi:hypothetical protein